jgi:hypothetical protein
MRLNTSAKVSGGVLLAILLFWIWYSVAADYSYKAVSGTYDLRGSGETSTLVLKPDRSFQQDLVRAGKSEHAEGSWHRSGEGGIDFSKEFLKVTGQEMEPDGGFAGHIEKSLGLFVSIELNANPAPGGPTFHKRLFR